MTVLARWARMVSWAAHWVWIAQSWVEAAVSPVSSDTYWSPERAAAVVTLFVANSAFAN